MLYVHVIGVEDPDDVRSDVEELERLVVAAIEPRDPAERTPRPAVEEDR